MRLIRKVMLPLLAIMVLMWTGGLLFANGQAQNGTKTPSSSTSKSTTSSPASYVNASRADTVVFDIDGGAVASPTLFNPFVPGASQQDGFHQAVNEPLFILNYETGKVDPWLGLSMTSNKALDVWTLKLRHDVKWSDGVPFTANDVVFTINMLKNTPGLSYNQDMKAWVKDVKAIDNYTVEFDLNKPDPRFQLDYFSVKIWGGIDIVPEHIWKGKDPLTFTFYDPSKGWPVGTGPYTLASATKTQFVYVRDDNWWGSKTGTFPLPVPKKLIWTWVGTDSIRAEAMANNQIDSLMSISPGTYKAIAAKNSDITAWTPGPPYAYPDPCERNLLLNDTTPPWNNKDMRWALNYAINRAQAVQIAYQNSTSPSDMMFPDFTALRNLTNTMKGDPNFDNVLKFDPQKAESIIQANGYTKDSKGYYAKDGKELALDIQVDAGFAAEFQPVAQTIVQQLQNIGINATTRNIADATFANNQAFGSYEAQIAWNTCGSVLSPWGSMDTFNNRWLVPVGKRASGDYGRWDNAQYSSDVNKIGALPLDSPEVPVLFKDAMTIWYADLPEIPINQASKLVPFNQHYWTGWPTKANPYIQPTTWWQCTIEMIEKLKHAGS